MGITGNEVADEVADLEAHNPHEPSQEAVESTVTRLRTDTRALMCDAQSSWWTDRRPKFSKWYKRLISSYNTTPREERTSSPTVLTELPTIRTMHGNFGWYHCRYKHDNAAHLCSCGKVMSPGHLVHCPQMRHWFLQWPACPVWPPTNQH